MIPKQAIEKAIEGGWKQVNPHRQAWHSVALDPTFWQALGRTLGWPLKGRAWNCTHDDATWIIKAHEYCDLILSSGNSEAYWQEVLK